MKILGISAYYHDSAAAITIDGEIVAAAQEERFSRKKHDPGFPKEAIDYCLNEAGLGIEDLDAVAFYEKPLIKFERLLETYYAFSPLGFKSYLKAMPLWLKEKLFLKKLLRTELKKFGPFDPKKIKLLFPEHHLSHAASTFYPSPFEDSAILTIDGVGEWGTASICIGNGASIKILKELRFPHSLGLLYSAFTYFLGFRVNSGEYKLMGLAPYGDPTSSRVREFENTIKEKLIKIFDDGSIHLDQYYFSYAKGLRMVPHKKWEQLFGMKKREPEAALEQEHCDLGLAIQNITEDVVLKMAKTAKELTRSENLCLAGGVALNCVANGKLQQAGIFKNTFIQPASGDAGGAPGAALAAEHLFFEGTRSVQQPDALEGSYLGPEFTAKDIARVVNRYNAEATQFENESELVDQVADKLNNGKVVGWFQGRMEFGPRALGNRSILGNPSDPEMQRKLNLKIKYRESFRPFAPSVLEEEVSNWFETELPSPYMLLVHPINKSISKPLPEDYHSMDLRTKLYHERSEIPAITHIDMSARIQTVSKRTNPRYHKLISAFKQRSGYPIVINTSFNVRGEPIVCTPMDAYRCFMRTEMDVLVLNEFVFLKEKQPNWAEDKEWQDEYVLD